jgi:uncharacterized CHY-type Zn-finger protein
MKAKTMELCKPCAEELKAGGFLVKPVKEGVDRKIVCGQCKKRRYGKLCEVRKGEAG